MPNIKALALQGAAVLPVAFAADKAAEYYGTHSRHGFTNKQIGEALAVLMSGPKATRPTWRAVRKTILRIRAGLNVSKGGWRRWPHMGEVHNAI
jgi:hypothetical protein